MKFNNPQFLQLIVIVVSATFSAAVHSAAVDEPPVIGAVWNLSAQPCNGGIGNAMHRDPNQSTIQQSGVIKPPSLKLQFRVPRLPDLGKTFVKTYLGDKARGVVDHYILLSDSDLAPPVAAVVVTELPKDFDRNRAFAAVNVLERKLAKGRSIVFDRVNGPYGEALEFQLQNRLSTHCFPTADFQLSPDGAALPSIGISRFIFANGYLVEFSMIVKIPPGVANIDGTEYARRLMDNFWGGLVFL